MRPDCGCSSPFRHQRPGRILRAARLHGRGQAQRAQGDRGHAGRNRLRPGRAGQRRHGQRRAAAKPCGQPLRAPHAGLCQPDRQGLDLGHAQDQPGHARHHHRPARPGAVRLGRPGPGRRLLRWRDVHRTLRGEYGARTTREVQNDEASSVMYVSAPIMVEGRIAGVLTASSPRTRCRRSWTARKARCCAAACCSSCCRPAWALP